MSERQAKTNLAASAAEDTVLLRPVERGVVDPEALGQAVASHLPGQAVLTPGPEAGGAIRGFRLIAWGLAVTDALCILGALLLAEMVIIGGGSVRDPRFLGVLAFAAVLWLTVLQGFGLYGAQHLAASEEFRRLISAVTLAILLIFVGSLWWKPALSRSLIAWTWLLALLLELTGRRLWRWRIRRQKRTGELAFRTLLVGTNEEAAKLARILASPVRGYVPVGYVTGSEPDGVFDVLPVLGLVSELDRIVRDNRIECLFVASTAVTPADISQVSRVCRHAGVEMRISANLPEILTSRLTVQPIDEAMVLSVRPARLTGFQLALKHSFDVVAATVLLLLSLPITITAAVAIMVDSGRPILFRQERVTKDGRVFTMYKFRTMVRDSERALGKGTIDLIKPFFKLRNDPRLTKVGRILRPLSLDELPQLWNVLRGDMSMVGPRPLPAEQVAANAELLAPRQEVRAGLTGWWQINGRSDVETEDALRLDLFYVENWSLSLDLYIMLKTAGVLIARRGAY